MSDVNLQILSLCLTTPNPSPRPTRLAASLKQAGGNASSQATPLPNATQEPYNTLIPRKSLGLS